MFSKSRCLLCTVSHSFLIFSLTFSTSFAVSWSWWAEHSWSNSRSLIISSRQALSRSMFRRSRLRMYIRAAVHRARFWNKKKTRFHQRMGMRREIYISWRNQTLLTGCWAASLRILKTWATFPRALRCILKPGMAHRVARLIILNKRDKERLQKWLSYGSLQPCNLLNQ